MSAEYLATNLSNIKQVVKRIIRGFTRSLSRPYNFRNFRNKKEMLSLIAINVVINVKTGKAN